MSLRPLFLLFCTVFILGCGKNEEAKPPVESEAAPEALAPTPAVSTPAPPAQPEVSDNDPQAAPSVVAPPPDTAPMPPGATGSAPTAEAPTLELTQEMEASLVCVRIDIASTLQRDHTGVIIRPDEFQPALSGDLEKRFALVHIPAYDEASLRDKSCAIYVMRNRITSSGGQSSTRIRATLAAFDAATHVATVQFPEKFPYKLDAGLQADPAADIRSAAAASAVQFHIAQTSYGWWQPDAAPPQTEQQPAQTPMPPTQGRGPPGVPRSGMPRGYYPGMQPPAPSKTLQTVLRPAQISGGDLALADLPDTIDSADSVVVLTNTGKLAGFATRAAGTGKGPGSTSLWHFHTYTLPSLDLSGPSYVIDSLQIERSASDQSRVTLNGRLADAMHETAKYEVILRDATKEEAAAFTPSANPAANHAATKSRYLSLFIPEQQDGTLTFTTRLTSSRDTTKHQFLQVQLKQADSTVIYRSAPILLTTTLRGAGVYYSAIGAPCNVQQATATAPSATATAKTTATATAATDTTTPAPGTPVSPDAGLKPLITESRILYGVPLCEGRELLLKLDSAPHWKRLSLATGQWLPLPPEDLSTAHLTGNKDALFILFPALREVRRYNAATLHLEKTTHLPQDYVYQGLAIGCLTTTAPLAVVTPRDIVTCDPKTLAPTFHVPIGTYPSIEQPISEKCHFIASGDSTLLRSMQDASTTTYVQRRSFIYEDDFTGYKGLTEGDYTTTPVSAAFHWDRKGLTHPGTAMPTHLQLSQSKDGHTTGTFPSSPSLYHITAPNYDKTTGTSSDKTLASHAKIYLYSYSSDQPWATLDVPEAGDVATTSWRTYTERVWFDPFSLTLAIWHADKNISLHTLDKATLPVPDAPVLLNYPDAFVPRGTHFAFTPQIHTGPAPSTPKFALLSGPTSGLLLSPDGSLSWDAPAEAIQQKLDITFEITPAPVPGQPPQRSSTQEISLHLGGQQPVIAARPTLTLEAARSLIQEMGKGAPQPAARPILPLTHRYFHSESPIATVLPGLTDYFALQMRDESLALLSTQTWQIAGSIPLPKNITPFMAGDTLYTYDSITRTLCRHSIPDLGIVQRIAMPRTAELVALGVGEAPIGALCLVLREKVDPKPGPGTRNIISINQHSLFILDKQTLKPTKAPPFTPKSADASSGAIGSGIPQLLSKLEYSAFGTPRPITLPTSADGRLVSFPVGKLFASPTFVTEFLYPVDISNSHYGWAKNAASSASGDRLFAGQEIHFGNRSTGRFTAAGESARIEMSRCGSYLTHLSYKNNDTLLKLISTDGGRPLLTIVDPEILKVRDGNPASTTPGTEYQQVFPMGDINRLLLLTRGGKTLQIIDLDLATTCASLNPDSAYVTSHPFPIVAQGRTLDYQVTLNNPAALKSCTLRDSIPGTGITPQGHFSYRAPVSTSGESKQVNISILIELKNNDIIHHEFSLFSIAVKPGK